KEIAPAFRVEVEDGWKEDFRALDGVALLARLEHWLGRVLLEFARHSLKPSALAQEGLKKIELVLEQPLGTERARSAARELIMGVHPDPESDLAGAVKDLAAGKLQEAEFLTRFGHRCGQEMELSLPRWAEAPERLHRTVRAGGRTALLSRPDGSGEPSHERI